MTAVRRIHLIRHGRSVCAPSRWLSREEYRLWVEAYDAAGIDDRPPEPLRQWLRDAEPARAFSSSLPRSVQSARALFPSERIRSDPVFDETAIAIVAVPFRMSSALWTLAGRISWMYGGTSRETITQARVRASEAAEALTQATAEGDAVLVGHGWMNRMIGAELRSRGFVRVGTASGGHWSAASFHR